MKLERSSFSGDGWRKAMLFLVVSSLAALGQVNVLTQHNDNARTGANLSETILTTSNVNVNTFGKLFANSVDGQVYAQPLYVQGLNIAGGTHNVVFVSTENNSVYAFDADSSGVTYWHKNFGTPFSSTCSDLSPVVGITGTPVIDLSSGTLYVDTKLASGPSHKLHALSIFDGSEKFGGPVTISASNFSASIQHQRPGLLLLNGVVYLAFGSHCDGGSYHGFLMAFDAGTLSHLNTLNTTSSSSGTKGSIWQSGMGPAADSGGNIYFITGNGDYNGGSNLGESYVKVNGSLGVLDHFTPSNWSNLNSSDTDLGAGGAVLVPSHFIVGLGKDGNLHLVDQNSMGGLGGGLQSFSAASSGDTTGASPVYWQGPSKQYIFVSHSNSPTKSFEFTGASINTTPLGANSVTQNDRAGGTSLSANGTSNGILWVIGSDSKVRAYDAVNFPTELWDSGQNSSRDSMGSYVKFVAPTIANGKVYIATQNSLVVYGLLPSSGPPPAPTNLTATAGSAQVLLSWTASTGVTSYHVKRATVSDGPYTTVGSPTSTSFTDTGLTNGTTYFYVVTAVNSAGESGNSNQASATPQAVGPSISINFVGNGVTPMGSTESAGVVAKTNWNNASGSSGSGQALLDENGASTSATLTSTADHTTVSGITDTAGNFRMMKGSVNTSNTSTTTITVSGLTSRSYDIYLYFNENTFGASRTSSYTISGTGITTTTIKGTDNAQFNGTFTQANSSVGNYVKFSITATGFTITAKPVSSTDTNLRAPVNGIQIIATSP